MDHHCVLLFVMNWFVFLIIFIPMLVNTYRINRVNKALLSYGRGFRALKLTKEVNNVEVRLRDGTAGIIIGKNRGWLSIQVRGTSEIVKARRTQVTQASPRFKVDESEVPEMLQSKEPAFTHIQAPQLHQNTHKWIVFSDLHVKPTSIETCEKVLEHIHMEAERKQAGVIFLGDFWHVRGSLNVDLLNRVLKVFEQWSRPVIMIPGNHDQVNLGGSIHALEPLVYAFPRDHALLLSSPALLLNALWLPYRRDHSLLRTSMQALSPRPSDPHYASAVFCHVDVQGAYMNEGVRSREGMGVEAFPSSIPIYSGHFHKPHTLSKNGVRLRYVGSPYQTSLSEADQQKFLYLLSSSPTPEGVHMWKEEERWGIDIGRKYYKAMGLSDEKLTKALPGDKVILSVSRVEKDQADTLAKELRYKGIDVEIRADDIVLDKSQSVIASDSYNATSVMRNDSENMSQLDADRVFAQYLDTLSLEALPLPSLYNKSKLNDTAGLNLVKQSLLREGQQLINSLLESSPQVHHTVQETKDLSFSHIELMNFGPYGGESITYPLSKRGLVLIKGIVEDETGADSNGSGKTTLAMSVMWCLTGSLDSRLVDSRSADVTYDSSVTDESIRSKRSAVVSLSGQVNGKSFTVTRKKNSRKTELNFILDGTDLTTLSLKDTQALIDLHLGIGNNLLARCCFYGQHSHTQQSLLGLQDTGLKYELGKLIDVNVWIEAAKLVRFKSKDIADELGQLGYKLKSKKDDVGPAEYAFAKSREELDHISNEQNYHEDRLIVIKQRVENIIDLCKESEKRLQEISKEKADLQQNVLEPTRKALLALLQQSQDKVIDMELSALTLEMNTLENTLQNQERFLDSKKEELRQIMESIDLRRIDIDDTQSTWSYESIDDWSQSSLSEKLALWKGDLESSISMLGSLDANIQSTNSTYQDLRRLCHLTHAYSPTTLAMNEGEVVSEITDACPTCGQAMPTEDRLERLEKSRVELQNLLASRQEVYINITDMKKNIITVQRLLDLLKANEQDIKEKGKLEEEELKLDTYIKDSIKIYEEHKVKCKVLHTTQTKNEERYQSKKESLQSMLQHAEQKLKALEEQYMEEISTLDNLQSDKKYFMKQQSELEGLLNKVKSQLYYANKSLEEKEERLLLLNTELQECVSEKARLMNQSELYDMLGSLFGPKGIQNYIFSTALSHLEALCNDYLQVLAEGGMQLSLHSDEDGEKIIKTAMMKYSGAEGVYQKERALSLLSGGQWRRVSLALDLAFTDMIRKQGKLRCSLLVMDEVLSHLDGQGREAVGSILRALASPSAYQSKDPDSFSGVSVVDTQDIGEKERKVLRHDHLSLLEMDPYETILVILQDAAAAEMEESFDHIDVVTRRGDVSTVKVDGLA